MRVALIASGFVDYSMELAGALAPLCEVALFADAAALHRERDGAPDPAGVRLRAFRQHDRLHRWVLLPLRLRDLARWRPDAVVAHEHPHPHLTAVLRRARALAPLGLIVHDPEPHPGRDGDLARRRGRDIALGRALATHLFAHGETGVARLAGATGRRATALRHGPILRPATPPPASAGRQLLVFGRMEAYKGLDTLLEAHRLARAAAGAHQLLLIGEGPELDRRAAAFQALGGCRVVHGHASRTALLDALAASALVVAPYTHASASGVAAAAMANGRGLVACPVGELADMARAGVNAVLAPPADARALARALEEGLDRAPALGAGARTLAEGDFAWSHAAEAIVAALTAPNRAPSAPAPPG